MKMRIRLRWGYVLGALVITTACLYHRQVALAIVPIVAATIIFVTPFAGGLQQHEWAELLRTLETLRQDTEPGETTTVQGYVCSSFLLVASSNDRNKLSLLFHDETDATTWSRLTTHLRHQKLHKHPT